MKSITDSVTEILCVKRKEKIKLEQDYDDLFNLNMCDHCNKCVATCNGDPLFGLAIGLDNVIQCDMFYPIITVLP